MTAFTSGRDEPERNLRNLGEPWEPLRGGPASEPLRPGSEKEDEGPAELVQAEVGEPVPIGPGTPTYRRRRVASISDNREGEAREDRRSDAGRPAAEYRGKVGTCMPS